MIIPGIHPNQRASSIMSGRLILSFALVAVAFFGTPAAVSAGELTKAVCEADYKELLRDIERNRLAGIKQINEHLVGLTDEKERSRLIEMREKSWDTEEEQRAIAGNIRRDCLAAVK